MRLSRPPSQISPAAAYRRLHRAYGPQGWWPTTAYGAERPAYHPSRVGARSEREREEICIGAILTQNTAWSNVEKALACLHRAGVWTMGDIARLGERKLAGLIRSSGYFKQKAKKLKIMAARVQSRGAAISRWLSGPLAKSRQELLGLWGVGPETADSILLYAAGRLAFVVDAYTLRIGGRVGWFRGRDYASAQEYLIRRLPKSVRAYNEFHALIVRLAKEHCRTAPVCPGCPLLGGCRHGMAHA